MNKMNEVAVKIQGRNSSQSEESVQKQWHCNTLGKCLSSYYKCSGESQEKIVG